MSSAAAVLFLDREWRPLRVETWQTAITALFLGKVEIIEHSADRTIRGVERTYPMPSVVRLLRHFKRDKQRLRFSRVNIYVRDKFTCQYCGKKMMTEDLTFDHVVPRKQGGVTSWENIVTACVKCNLTKGPRTPAEANMPLLSRPVKPYYLPAIMVREMGGTDIPDEWRRYWTSALDK